jgi:hypothetical protein
MMNGDTRCRLGCLVVAHAYVCMDGLDQMVSSRAALYRGRMA